LPQLNTKKPEKLTYLKRPILIKLLKLRLLTLWAA